MAAPGRDAPLPDSTDRRRHDLRRPVRRPRHHPRRLVLSRPCAIDANTIHNMRTPVARSRQRLRARTGARPVPVRHRPRRTPPRSRCSSERTSRPDPAARAARRSGGDGDSHATATSRACWHRRTPPSSATHATTRTSSSCSSTTRCCGSTTPSSTLLLAGGVHRRHLRRGQADRHPPLPVGRRERLPDGGSAAPPAVTDALDVRVGSRSTAPFRMPVEFSVAAYRFGHSMIRDTYWVNFNFPNATLGQVFEFNRNPHLPVRSNWVVDFNAFFPTRASPVPVLQQGAQDRHRHRAGLDVAARVHRDDGDARQPQPAPRPGARAAQRPRHGQGVRHHATDRAQLRSGPTRGRGHRPDRRRRCAAAADPALVLRPPRGRGAPQRQPARPRRWPHRRRDVRADPQARSRLVRQRSRQRHPVPAGGDPGPVHLRRPRRPSPACTCPDDRGHMSGAEPDRLRHHVDQLARTRIRAALSGRAGTVGQQPPDPRLHPLEIAERRERRPDVVQQPPDDQGRCLGPLRDGVDEHAVDAVVAGPPGGEPQQRRGQGQRRFPLRGRPCGASPPAPGTRRPPPSCRRGHRRRRPRGSPPWGTAGRSGRRSRSSRRRGGRRSRPSTAPAPRTPGASRTGR